MKTLRFASGLAFVAGAGIAASALLAAPVKTRARANPFTVTSSRVRSLSTKALAATQKTDTRGQVSSDKKTITFTAKSVRLVATTGPENDMLSYRIAGLRNPTLDVPAGATLRVLFVNTDEDMTHNLRFSTLRPPFGNTVQQKQTAGSHTLPHSGEGVYRADEMAVRVPAKAGTYSYLCTVMGHAKGGMYGTVTVRSK